MNTTTQNECYTVSRLRDEFKLRPRKDAPVARTYKNDYGTICKLYNVVDCVPIRQRTNSSEKQIQAQKLLGIRAKLKSKRMIAAKKAHDLLKLNPVFLDTETTGLGSNAQIIEIALTDQDGNVLLESRLKPTIPVELGAFDVHGISDNDLINAPSWLDISTDLQAILANRVCVIFNSDFDERLILQTAQAFNDDVTWFYDVKIYCAMALAAKCFGSSNRYGSISLVDATYYANVNFRGSNHSAVVDAQATADVIKAMAQSYIDLASQLE